MRLWRQQRKFLSAACSNRKVGRRNPPQTPEKKKGERGKILLFLRGVSPGKKKVSPVFPLFLLSLSSSPRYFPSFLFSLLLLLLSIIPPSRRVAPPPPPPNGSFPPFSFPFRSLIRASTPSCPPPPSRFLPPPLLRSLEEGEKILRLR